MKFSEKVPHYISIAFGLLILFAFVKNWLGNHDAGVNVFVLTTLFWCAGRIMQEAITAIALLREAKLAKLSKISESPLSQENDPEDSES